MKLLAPTIFDPFPEVVAAMSMRDTAGANQLNMSRQQESKIARTNRQQFAAEIGFDLEQLAAPEQNHTDIVHVVQGEYHPHPGDGVITSEPGWLLGITVADCVPLLLFDPLSGSYGAIHSGWRGSAQNIAGITVQKMMREFSLRPENLYAWIGPSADKATYEVGYDVVSQFNPKYSTPLDADRWLFDNKRVVHDQLLDNGLRLERIEISSLDTISNPELHSERRDEETSGRMLAAIGITR
ncbi:MAG: peptidoglycan editing factor PgeF [Candidatus Saccharimonadales bacterium]